MKNIKYILTLFAFILCMNISGKNRLITIYDNECGFCYSLLNETYKNKSVKEYLNNYEYQLFEANTKKGIELIQKYNITTYPTQIVIINEKEIILNGFLNSEEQVSFLKNPSNFKNSIDYKQNNSNLKLISQLHEKDTSFVHFPKRHYTRICGIIYRARSSDHPVKVYFKGLRSVINRLNMNIKESDFLNFAFSNLAIITCGNSDTVKIRKLSTVLKHVLDSRNYGFIRSVMFIKQNGKNICNPYIDFTRKEIINGEEETLIQFIDKILNKDGMDAFHDFGAIRSIRNLITSCINDQTLYETHELQNLSENELKQIRLKQGYFFNKTDKHSQIGYYSRKDKIKKYGLIDRSGSLIIPLEYEKISFRIEENGLIAVSKNGKWGFINLKNEIVIPLKYKNTYPEFENGKARVLENGKEFYIDRTGKCIENCE